MNLIFMGKQGSGKGTQAKIISEKLGLCHISTGDLVRGVEGELKKEVDALINKGNLISDELMFEILKERVKKSDCEKGIILDGYPRNLNQAKTLQENFEISKVIDMDIPDEEVLNRLVNRLNCKKCGAIFNKLTNPPKQEGICDFCGSELFVRDDDHEDAIRKRLEIYHRDTNPILSFFKEKVVKINGNQKIEDVTKEILEKLSF